MNHKTEISIIYEEGSAFPKGLKKFEVHHSFNKNHSMPENRVIHLSSFERSQPYPAHTRSYKFKAKLEKLKSADVVHENKFLLLQTFLCTKFLFDVEDAAKFNLT